MNGLLAPVYTAALALADRLTTQRATNLDEITAARMAKLDALESRLTAARMASLDALELRLTAARAALIDEITAARMERVDAAISSRAEASTALSTETWSNARAENLDQITAARMALINEIAARMTKVDAMDERLTAARAVLLDNLGAGVPAVKSVQRGAISFGTNGASASATISAVNTAKSALSHLGFEGAPLIVSGDDIYGSSVRLVLINSTTISATRSSATGLPAATVSWELVEYY